MFDKLKAIGKLKCPACYEGYLFASKSKFVKWNFDMNKKCPSCGEDLEREPGFYYGAMFISYIISGLFSLIFVGTAILVFHVQWEWAIVLLGLVLIISFSYLFKLSRTVWIHLILCKKN